MNVLRWDNEAGRAVIAAAANLWSGSSIPDWRENEYARGQVETIADSVQLYTDEAVERGIDGEQLKDRAWTLMYEAQEPHNLPVMTETAFKQRWAGFEGDALSQGRFNVTVEGWEDVTETPSECIQRLNAEVIELGTELTALQTAGRDDHPEQQPDLDVTYTLCAVAECPFFVDENPAYADSTEQFPIAQYLHLTRGEGIDEEWDDHEPTPGVTRPLSWWKQHGPARVKERFV